jgi:hypothetical protein
MEEMKVSTHKVERGKGIPKADQVSKVSLLDPHNGFYDVRESKIDTSELKAFGNRPSG